MVASEVLNKERKIKQDSRGKTTHHRQLGKARLRAATDLVWSRLSLGEKTASIHSCGNLIGPLFLAARSQTEILPPTLFKSFFFWEALPDFPIIPQAKLDPPSTGQSWQPAHASFTDSISLHFDYLFTNVFPTRQGTYSLDLSM